MSAMVTEKQFIFIQQPVTIDTGFFQNPSRELFWVYCIIAILAHNILQWDNYTWPEVTDAVMWNLCGVNISSHLKIFIRVKANNQNLYAVALWAINRIMTLTTLNW